VNLLNEQQVAFDEAFGVDLEDGLLAVVQTANEATFVRLSDSLARLTNAKSRVRDLLFGLCAVPPLLQAVPFEPLNSGLNDTQRQAVGLCLAKNDVTVIHGPPGTGKTTTVVETIAQMVLRGDKVCLDLFWL
jgi:predicted ABC-class ATPase